MVSEVKSWTAVVHELGGNVVPSSSKLVVDGLRMEDAIWFMKRHFREITATLKAWNATEAEIRVPHGNPFVIPASLPAQFESGGVPRKVLYTSFGRLDLLLNAVITARLENPRMGAIIQLSDEKQIVVCDPTGNFYPDPEGAVQHYRHEYWNLSDLEELRKLSRSQNSFEFRYRADDFPGANDWSWITTRFRLFQDEYGDFYHECDVLDFQEIGAIAQAI